MPNPHDSIWLKFREEHGPRPMGRHAQEVWEAEWKEYNQKHCPHDRGWKEVERYTNPPVVIQECNRCGFLYDKDVS